MRKWGYIKLFNFECEKDVNLNLIKVGCIVYVNNVYIIFCIYCL